MMKEPEETKLSFEQAYSKFQTEKQLKIAQKFKSNYTNM